MTPAKRHLGRTGVGILLASVCALTAGAAGAQSCSTTAYPYTLSNGSTADASQVTANLNCAAVYGLANTTLKVGIGTTSPLVRLTVSTSSSQSVDGLGLFAPDSHSVYLLPSSGAGDFNGIVQAGDAVLVFSNGAENTGALNLTPWASSASGLRITSAGVVSVDTASPPSGYVFYVNGAAAGSSGFATASDARMKTDVTTITSALETVERLRGVRYRWLPSGQRPVGKTLDLPVDKPQIGFLAQDVQKVVPEAVNAPKPGSDDIYTLDQAKLIPILVEAIKEQEKKIAALEGKIAKLEAAR